MEISQLLDKKPQLVMRLNNLFELPKLDLPEGYSISSFKTGCEKDWELIISDAFKRDISFNECMASDVEFRPQRVFFINYKEIPIATASAWYHTKWEESTGYLHMVGVISAHTGKRLGFLVSLAALYKMKEEGRKDAVLQTDDFRIAAIKTYLKLGFKPEIVHENQVERWENIFTLIGRNYIRS